MISSIVGNDLYHLYQMCDCNRYLNLDEAVNNGDDGCILDLIEKKDRVKNPINVLMILQKEYPDYIHSYIMTYGYNIVKQGFREGIDDIIDYILSYDAAMEHKMMKEALKNSDFHIVDYLTDHELRYPYEVALEIVKFGYIDLLDRMISTYPILEERTSLLLAAAVKYGHLRLAEHLIDEGATVSIDALYNAVHYDRLTILKYMMENDPEAVEQSYILRSVAENAHRSDIKKYLSTL